jgi:hypothetical protein
MNARRRDDIIEDLVVENKGHKDENQEAPADEKKFQSKGLLADQLEHQSKRLMRKNMQLMNEEQCLDAKMKTNYAEIKRIKYSATVNRS